MARYFLIATAAGLAALITLLVGALPPAEQDARKELSPKESIYLPK